MRFPHVQGRNEVRWRPGQEASLAFPCLNLSFFRNKYTVLKKARVTLLRFFSEVIRHLANGAPLSKALFYTVGK